MASKGSNMSELAEGLWWSYVFTEFGTVRSTHPWELALTKIWRRQRAKSAITPPRIRQFRSIFTEFEHVTPDVQQKFKVRESKVKVTAW